MRNLLFLALATLLITSCDNPDRTKPTMGNTQAGTTQVDPTTTQDPDNTGRNIRDRDSNTKTSFDQGEDELDLHITQNIRKAVVADNSLSTNAQNIKIITINGIVTLRGPVSSAQEMDKILQKVNQISGIKQIDNQIEVTRK